MLAGEGARVAITDILDEPGQALEREIRAAGGQVGYWHMDVARETEVAAVFRQIAGEWGTIDVLVNNAGIAGINRPTHELDEADWDALMAVNVKGVFFCTKHVIPYMRAGGGGSIVNLSSIYGLVGGPDVPPYHASKGAVRLMTKTDALLYATDRIRVNSVHPGYIWTPMVENYLKTLGDPAELRKGLDQLQPVGHIGEPNDVAFGILYLASDESRFVTGSELVIDGGYTAR
jgi:NAD(P)-dependent dehydrogenase (short-subunit alcohol dehydrogenase family)